MRQSEQTALSVDFLYELYNAAFKYDSIASIVSSNVKNQYLPDKLFQKLNKSLRTYFSAYKTKPSYGVMVQKFADDEDMTDLISEIRDTDYIGKIDALIDDLEDYIKSAKLANIYEEIGELYNKGDKKNAQSKLVEYAKWLSSFTLRGDDFVEIISTFESRHIANEIKKRAARESQLTPVTKFYIDALDSLNDNRDLRGQVACVLASSGVGKSHAARHIGTSSAEDGLNVLHIQLEGSKSEVEDAYSGSLISENSHNFEQAMLSTEQMKRVKKQLAKYQGTIRVKCFPKFNNQVSTVDISNTINAYKKNTNYQPDIVIIDSMDLLTDSSGKNYAPKDERHKRISVVNDLKDIATDENCFIVSTTQATINDREWLNDAKNVFTEYNAAEAKGIVRPLTWLISLNQTDQERADGIMRLHVAKSRFTRKSDTFKIATNFDREMFYDRETTLAIQE